MPDKEQLSFADVVPNIQEDAGAYKTIVVHFRDQEAVEQFAKAIGQKVYPKTRRLWYPDSDM
jgi:hypothetical protein